MTYLRLVGTSDPTSPTATTDPLQLLQESCVVSREQLAAGMQDLDPKLVELLTPQVQQAVQALQILENAAIIAAFRTGAIKFNDPPGPVPT